ncbi:MAG TPA: bifunctional precorrin-2 dehydrogenase/sirohydrochlorin ferrochelatase [Acidobacteriaceae bacterium]|nr:bifunctional precorrin-2 dehydrogenase/sirohydrochlorin ferrochelatase [Acidobacteriaceae bacterium]
MSLFPAFLKLSGRACLVVGAGHVALSKIESLVHAGAKVHVLSPKALPEIEEMECEQALRWTRREYESGDVLGSFLVIAATDNVEVNHCVYRDAANRGILCNVVDDPPYCDFYFPSVVQRGPLQIAVSTEGESPAVAQRMRRELDAALPSDLGPWVQEMGRLRREVRTEHPACESRTRLLHTLAQRPLCELEHCPTRRFAREANDGTCSARLV